MANPYPNERVQRGFVLLRTLVLVYIGSILLSFAPLFLTGASIAYSAVLGVSWGGSILISLLLGTSLLRGWRWGTWAFIAWVLFRLGSLVIFWVLNFFTDSIAFNPSLLLSAVMYGYYFYMIYMLRNNENILAYLRFKQNKEDGEDELNRKIDEIGR